MSEEENGKGLPPKLAELVTTTRDQLADQAAAEERLAKELKAFSGGLPYDRARIIDKTQESLKKGVMAYFKVDCGMILLHENDRQTFAGILEQHFPGISERAARNYRRFAREAAKHPQFRAFCEERGGWAIALTILQSCTEQEVEEFEETGEIRGLTKDRIAQMSVRTLQKALMRAEASKEKAVATATHKLQTEVETLKSKVEGLEEELEQAPTHADKAVALVKSADRKVLEAGALLGKISPELLGAHPTLVHLVLGVCGTAMRVLQGLEEKAMAAYAAVAQESEGEGDRD